MFNLMANLIGTVVGVAVFGIVYFIQGDGMIAALAGCVTALVIMFIGKLRDDEKSEKQKDTNKKIKFYKKCVGQGIKSLDSEKNIERAKLIAKNDGHYYGTDIKAFFNECKNLAEQAEIEARKNEEKSRALKLSIKDHDDLRRFTEYADCIENQKTVKYLKKHLQNLINKKDQMESFGRRASAAFTEKEKDWATHGGIASGIAGTAAGVATALNVQAENAQIRERNAGIQNSINQIQNGLYASGSISRVSDSIDSVRAQIESEKMKLSKKLSEDIVKEHLSLGESKVTVSETGAFRVELPVEITKDLIIFDDISARIDGKIICRFSQKDKVVGEAVMVFPVFGIHYKKNKRAVLQGICIEGIDQNVEYSISYDLSNLWGVED